MRILIEKKDLLSLEKENINSLDIKKLAMKILQKTKMIAYLLEKEQINLIKIPF